MAESTFDRLVGEHAAKLLRPPADAARRRRMLLGIAAAVTAGAIGLAAGAARGRIAAWFETPPPAPTAIVHEIPDITVSLRPTSAVKLMKIGITVQISSADAAALTALEPAIIDGLTAYLRQLDENDLDGVVGLERLRANLSRRITLLAEPTPINGVLLRTLILH